MARIINLNELVGEDIVFEYGEPPVQYAIPADVETATVFELFDMYVALAKIDDPDPEKAIGDVKQRFSDITGRLLTIFQIRDPQLTELPFGPRGTGVVLRHVLSSLGFGVTDDSPDPQKSAPKKQAPRRSTSVKTRTASRKRT